MSLPIPLTRINPITRYWEISTDGGTTYTSTGILADGQNGKDGSAEDFNMSDETIRQILGKSHKKRPP
jgi:hypothetical protein